MSLWVKAGTDDIVEDSGSIVDCASCPCCVACTENGNTYNITGVGDVTLDADCTGSVSNGFGTFYYLTMDCDGNWSIGVSQDFAPFDSASFTGGGTPGGSPVGTYSFASSTGGTWPATLDVT